jgi:nucleoside phosphorylase
MILLHIAHRGEAQHFISTLDLKASQEVFAGVYAGSGANNDLMLLIAGEGLTNTHNKLSYLLGKYPIKKVVNLGIAGVLDTSIKLDQIVGITTSYAFIDKPQFHSYSTLSSLALKASNNYSCITTNDRVLDDELAKKLAPFAPVVDRELWALASSCTSFGIKFESYKYLSDYAGINTECLDIKNRASEFSQKLLEFYLLHVKSAEQIKPTNLTTKINLPTDYHLTFTQKHQVANLLYKLASKWDVEVNEVIKLVLNDLKNEKDSDNKIRPKEKSLRLIGKLEQLLNPLKSKIMTKLQESVQDLNAAGATIHFEKFL